MKIISLISPKGGVGKTTIAIHLATEAERHNNEVAIIDLDPQCSACTWADQWEEEERYNMQVESLQPKRLEKALAKMQNTFDICIIDTAGVDDYAMRLASQVADMVLIPVRASLLDLTAVMDKYSLLNKKAYAILNALPPRGSMNLESEKILTDSGIEVIARITQRQDFTKAISEGMSAHEFNRKGKSTNEQCILYDNVIRHLFEE